MNKLPITFLGEIHFSYSVLKEMLTIGILPEKVIIRKNNFLPIQLDLNIKDKWYTEYQEYYYWENNIKTICNKHNIDIIVTSNYKHYLSSNKYLIVAGFSEILKEDIINLFEIPLNIHPSLLPYYRGPQPEARMILNEENYFGVSIHEITKKIDLGTIYYKEKLKYPDNLNIFNLEKKESKIAAKGIWTIINNKYKILKLSKNKGSYFSYITKNELNIINHASLYHIKNLLRLLPEEFPFIEINDVTIFPIKVANVKNGLKLNINNNIIYLEKWIEKSTHNIVYKALGS